MLNWLSANILDIWCIFFTKIKRLNAVFLVFIIKTDNFLFGLKKALEVNFFQGWECLTGFFTIDYY